MTPFPHIVDMSHGDPDPDWDRLKCSGVRAIIHKASQGADFKDPKYSERKAAALVAGFFWGAYHFGDDSDCHDQIDNFLSVVGNFGDTLHALDFEPNGANTMPLPSTVTFLSALGSDPVIYGGSLIKEQLAALPHFIPLLAPFRLWLSQYGRAPVTCRPWGARPWAWQYAADGVGPWSSTIPGFSGHADVSCYMGEQDDISKDWL